MQLSAEMFAAILDALNRHGQSDRPHENRRAPRMPVRSGVTMIPCSGPERGRPVPVYTRDFSARGVCLVHSQAMETGEQFVIQLPRKDQPPTTLLCAVAHCRPLGPGLFTIGAEFTCILAEENAPAGEMDEIGESILM